MKNQEDFLIGVGDELAGGITPLSKLASEREWLQKVGMEKWSMEEFLQEAVEESQEFRRGLKEAMLGEGVEERVVDGMFKEAEEVMVRYMSGLETETNPLMKTAFWGVLNAGMRSLKQPILQSLAKNRGFFGSGAKATANPDVAINRMMRNMAPGLTSGSKPVMEQLHRGTLRMGLGNWLEGKGMTGLGSMLQNSGQRAMQGQATRVSDRLFTKGFNQTAGQAAQASRTAAGLTPKLKGELNTYKNLSPGNQNSLPGAIPASTIERAKVEADRILKNPAGAQKLTAGGGIGGVGSGHVRFTPGKGLMRGAIGAGLGTMVAGPVGGILGGAGGLATGTLGTGGTALGLGGLYAGSKLLGGGAPAVDATGMPADRNRVLPMMSNNWTGAAGGALLASIIAREMGLEGPMAWLLPLLGGVAGYKFLPGLINSWSDPKGIGVNAIPMAQRINPNTYGYKTRP